MLALFRNLELKVACIAFVVTLSMVTLNVILRYLFSKSLLFSEEIAYLGFAHTVFLGAAYLYRERVMIAVEFVVDMMSNSVRHVLVIASLFILQVATIYMTYIAYLLVTDGWVRRTSYLEMPYAYIHSAPLFGFALMTIYTAVMLYQALTGHVLHYAEAADQK
jgi:TRAP-type C4-dicarboxylate transport system permease small subunit